jgi:hypothetical protein
MYRKRKVRPRAHARGGLQQADPAVPPELFGTPTAATSSAASWRGGHSLRAQNGAPGGGVPRLGWHAFDALPSDNGGLPAGATGHVAGEPDGFCRMHGVGPASRSGGLQCAEPEGGFHVARDAGLTLSPVRCDPRRVYSSLATSLFAMCQVYAGRGGDVKGGSDAV